MDTPTNTIRYVPFSQTTQSWEIQLLVITNILFQLNWSFVLEAFIPINLTISTFQALNSQEYAQPQGILDFPFYFQNAYLHIIIKLVINLFSLNVAPRLRQLPMNQQPKRSNRHTTMQRATTKFKPSQNFITQDYCAILINLRVSSPLNPRVICCTGNILLQSTWYLVIILLINSKLYEYSNHLMLP